LTTGNNLCVLLQINIQTNTYKICGHMVQAVHNRSEGEKNAHTEQCIL